MNYSTFFECREPGVLPESPDDDEFDLQEREREAEWQRQQRAAEWSVPDDGEAPWDWSPADEARIESALSELQWELRTGRVWGSDDDTPF